MARVGRETKPMRQKLPDGAKGAIVRPVLLRVPTVKSQAIRYALMQGLPLSLH